MIRKRAIVHGMVQGVGFRYTAQREAERLSLAGFARNLADGTVEVEIEGDAQSVERMLQWLSTGPRHARVDGVDVQELQPKNETGFRITG